jgi:uncharacterized protein YdhG (YjbR/CyaY superfamily)
MRKGNESVPVKSVDDYLKALLPDVRASLLAVRNAIKAAAPKAEEVISYGIPTYKHKGMLIHFASFKNHCGLYVVNKNILKTFAKELMGYYSTGSTIHFTPDKPLPVSLIKKIVKLRIAENEEREVLKALNKTGK